MRSKILNYQKFISWTKRSEFYFQKPKVWNRNVFVLCYRKKKERNRNVLRAPSSSWLCSNEKRYSKEKYDEQKETKFFYRYAREYAWLVWKEECAMIDKIRS